MSRNAAQLRHERRRERQEQKRKLLRGGSILYRDETFQNDPTRRIKDPTPHYSYEKDKAPSAAFGRGSVDWRPRHAEITESLRAKEAGLMMNHIRERREQLGLSQTQLACKIGLAQGALSNIELGKWLPWERVRNALVEALKCSDKDLFPDSE